MPKPQLSTNNNPHPASTFEIRLTGPAVPIIATAFAGLATALLKLLLVHMGG